MGQHRGHIGPYGKARGTRDVRPQSRMIAIRFEQEIFTQLATEAHQRGISFAELVRLYVGLGMDAER